MILQGIWTLLIAILPHATAQAKNGALGGLALRVSNTWLQYLEPDPETDLYAPNKQAREVQSGHYVVVKPTRLPDPGSARNLPIKPSPIKLYDVD
jgi:hypothetical protein